MFCGKDKAFGKMSREHFVPKGLWDGPRPKGTITLPAHESCNGEFASDNDYFRDVMAADQRTWNNPMAQQLRQGKLKRKMEKQFGAVAKTFRNLRMIDVHSPAGLYLGRAPAFEVDCVRINRVLCNIAKGVFYVIKDRPVPNDFSVDILPREMLINPEIRHLIDMMGPINSFGDHVFQCRCLSNTESESDFACIMRFYETQTFLACVTSTDGWT